MRIELRIDDANAYVRKSFVTLPERTDPLPEVIVLAPRRGSSLRRFLRAFLILAPASDPPVYMEVRAIMAGCTHAGVEKGVNCPLCGELVKAHV